MRTAYDLGSRFGMDFASDNSYSAIVDINICSMFCATPSALDDYMDKKAVEGGNITRTVLTADTGRPKLIDRLPSVFSRDQLRALISEAQVATPDRILVSQWKANNWIQETDKFLYKKLI